MAKNGSKYARKHFQEKPAVAAADFMTKSQKNDDDLWNILYTPENFIEQFYNLPYTRQLDFISLMHQLVFRGQKEQHSSLQKAFIREAAFHLDEIHRLTDSSYDEGVYTPLADDEKRLIRMECHGSINRRLPHQLSFFYHYFTTMEYIQRDKKQKFRLAEYDFNTSPTWQIFRQFETFRRIEPKVKRYLYDKQFNPDILKIMTVSDFCDAIFHTYKKSNSDECAYINETGESIKQRFVKQFMKHCGAAFEKRLIDKGIDERAVKSLCNAMRRFGICDLNSLKVTETHYTPQILQDLDNAGYNVSHIQPGDAISQVFVDELIDEHKEALILARDENGKILNKSALPSLELHHKHAVCFMADKKTLASANYPNNFLLVDSKMHSRYYHLFDRIVSSNKVQMYYSRLNANCRTMCSIIGFEIEDAICYDLEDNKTFQKRRSDDLAYKVNYFQKMEERLYNEQEISQKYQLDYSRRCLTKAYDDITEISRKLDSNSEQMKTFKNWLNKKYKASKGR